jgi:hypothetical protein
MCAVVALLLGAVGTVVVVLDVQVREALRAERPQRVQVEVDVDASVSGGRHKGDHRIQQVWVGRIGVAVSR